MKMKLRTIACTMLLALSVPAWADAATGAGSSAAAPIYRNWAQAYEKATGNTMKYESVGSSAGLRKIRGNEVGFGASDVAPPAAELKKDGLLVFPIAITGITPVINLPKVAADQLRLSGTVLARIFMGQITQWNAPEIAQLNAGLSLPNLPIKVIVRGDGSGTTYNFTDYLAKVHPDWSGNYGVKTSIEWLPGIFRAKGNEGVSKAVTDTVGAIAYVDFAYVREFRLTPVLMGNLSGEYVSASSESFRAALSASEWVKSGDYTSTLTQLPGRAAWPITMGTFALVPQVSRQPEQTLAALKFISWSFLHGDKLVQEASFVRLPLRVQAAAYKVISSVTDASGRNIGMLSTGF